MIHLSIYDLQYKVFPSLVDQFNNGEFKGKEYFDVLINEDCLKHFLIDSGVETCDISIGSIAITPFKLNNKINCILYKYPDPKRDPIAKYTLIVFEKKKREKEFARYFTLEYSINIGKIFEAREKGITIDLSSKDYVYWTLGEMNPEGHSNYGELENNSSIRENFINTVLWRFYNTKYEVSKLSKLNEYTSGFYYWPTKVFFFSALIPIVAPLIDEGNYYGDCMLIPLVTLLIWAIVVQNHMKPQSDIMFFDAKKNMLFFCVLFWASLALSFLII